MQILTFVSRCRDSADAAVYRQLADVLAARMMGWHSAYSGQAYTPLPVRCILYASRGVSYRDTGIRGVRMQTPLPAEYTLYMYGVSYREGCAPVSTGMLRPGALESLPQQAEFHA